jgi:hypothetical protein
MTPDRPAAQSPPRRLQHHHQSLTNTRAGPSSWCDGIPGSAATSVQPTGRLERRSTTVHNRLDQGAAMRNLSGRQTTVDTSMATNTSPATCAGHRCPTRNGTARCGSGQHPPWPDRQIRSQPSPVPTRPPGPFVSPLVLVNSHDAGLSGCLRKFVGG